MVRDLNISKVPTVLGSRIKSRNILETNVTFSLYKHREEEYLSFFTTEALLVYCIDVKRLIGKIGTTYNPCDWHLFVDSSKLSLKVVLLHNGNLFASVPLVHSTQTKKSYENMALLLTKYLHDEVWR